MNAQSFDFLQIAVGLAAIGSFLAAMASLPVSRRSAVWLILVAVTALTVLFSLAGPSVTARLLHVRSLWPHMTVVIVTGLLFGLWAHQLSKVVVGLIIVACGVALTCLVGAISSYGRDHQLDSLGATMSFYLAEVRPLLLRILTARLELLVGMVGLAGGIFADHLLLHLDRR